jgi:O-antigen ligase
MLGYGIGQSQWLFAIVALLIPFVVLYPVQVAFGIFALLIPFDTISVLGQAEKGRTLTALAGAATAVILLGAGLATRRLKSLPTSAVWWILFVLWYLATMVWGLNFGSSIQMLPTVVATLGLYLASCCFRYTEKELKAIVVLCILGGCVAALWTVHLYRQGTFFGTGLEMRGSLTVGERTSNPDGLGMDLLLPISLAFGYFLASKRKLVKAIMLLVMGMSILGLMLTMSRGAVLALLAMFFVYVYRLRLGWRIVAPAIVMALCLSLMPSVFFARFQEAQESGGSGRTDIWRVGLKAFEHYGVLGVGLNNFPYAYTNYMGEAPRYRGAYRDAHNIYLTVGVEAGVLGLLLFAGALIAHFRASSRLRNQLSVWNLLLASEAACWGMLVFGFFATILWSKALWLGWMLLSAAVTMAHDARQRSPAVAPAVI